MKGQVTGLNWRQLMWTLWETLLFLFRLTGFILWNDLNKRDASL